MFRIIIILLLLSPIMACEKETIWKINPGESFLITDCIITNELKKHELTVYWSSDSLNQPVEGFSGATVQITDGIGIVTFTEDLGNKGRYIANMAFRATVGRTYMLTISREGNSDTAFATMTGVTPLGEINIQPDGDYFSYIFNPAGAGYMLEVSYDWSDVPGFCELYGSCQALDVFYALNNIDPGKIFAPDKQKILFPHKTNIIRRKYSLSPEHQEFARSLLLETEWRGGIFDAEAGNVPTNFKNGMQGWFAVCMVVSDTTYFN
jgi:hypothetical protein